MKRIFTVIIDPNGTQFQIAAKRAQVEDEGNTSGVLWLFDDADRCISKFRVWTGYFISEFDQTK